MSGLPSLVCLGLDYGVSIWTLILALFDAWFSLGAYGDKRCLSQWAGSWKGRIRHRKDWCRVSASSADLLLVSALVHMILEPRLGRQGNDDCDCTQLSHSGPRLEVDFMVDFLKTGKQKLREIKSLI